MSILPSKQRRMCEKGGQKLQTEIGGMQLALLQKNPVLYLGLWKVGSFAGFVYVLPRSLKGKSLIHPSRLSEECDSFTMSSFGPIIPVTLGGTCSKGQGDKEAATTSMPTHFPFHKFTVRYNIIIEMILIL